MKRIGITGQNGFIGWHLYHTLKLFPQQYGLIEFDRSFFSDSNLLDGFINSCDVIVHLAGVNRHDDEAVVERTNIDLAAKLRESLKRTGANPHVIMSSSTQEERDNGYGRSKKKGRNYLAEWAANSDGNFTGMILPNVFGPFGKPFYNSFVATFCHLLCKGEKPGIQTDAEVPLIYVGEVVRTMREIIDGGAGGEAYKIKEDKKVRVSEVLNRLNLFKEEYLEKGVIPNLNQQFDINLFNTFRSYINHESAYPRKFQLNTDERGSFVEVVRLETGGQVSFSTTRPQITRGNHFHTRKVERFAVIRGKARIQLRKIGTDKVLNFDLNGDAPGYVDIPVWYTHNITNIGEDELYTIFWINEWYNADDADTYFEQV